MLWMYMTPNEIYFWKQCMSFIKTKIAKPSVHCSPVWGGLRSRWQPSSWRCRSRPGSGWPRRTSSARRTAEPAGRESWFETQLHILINPYLQGAVLLLDGGLLVAHGVLGSSDLVDLWIKLHVVHIFGNWGLSDILVPITTESTILQQSESGFLC